MTSPTVSVLMPVHNPERYIRQSLDSILSQTYRDFEIVVVDDGSTDGSRAILDRYAAQDLRIRVNYLPKQGLVPALNAGLAMARGPIVARMDHDDIALSRRFELQVAFLEAHPDVMCVGGFIEMIDEADRFLTTITLPCDDAGIQELLLHGHNSIFHPAAAFRREQAVALGGYDQRAALAEDLDMWLRLGELGKLANLPESILRYRLHGGSASAVFLQDQTERARGACERAWTRRGITGTFKSGPLWRPTADRASQHRFAVMYGWWAFNSGEKSTAAHYARKAIAAMPRKIEGWKLLACAYVKNPPKTEIRR